MTSSNSMPPFVLEISSFLDEKSRHYSKIMDHHFNHGVTLILPGCTSAPQEVRDCFTDLMVYRLTGLPVYRLMETPFVNAFVKNGSVQMISCGTKLDQHDCAALTPTGCLVLHLTKDTYQELGLDAAPQTHQQKKNDIFQVKIDLKADCFKPGKNGYEKTMNCLKNRLGLKFDFLISWVPEDSAICGSSVGVYFTELCQRVERADPVLTCQTVTSLACPQVVASDPEGNKQGCHFLDVFEWIGAVACDVDVSPEKPDSYTSSLSCPSPRVNCPRCCVMQVKGLIPPHTVLRLLQVLRQTPLSSPLPPSLSVHGFTDCPLVSGHTPHNFYLSGANLYSFVLLPDDGYWLYTAAVA